MHATRFARAALPQHCQLCAACSGDALLCTACDATLPRVAEPCPVCALPSPGAAPCGACIARPPPFAATIAALRYAFPVDALLRDLKYAGRLALADWAAGALARALRDARSRSPAVASVDCVVALPLSAPRQRERGFNQAREIAVRVARPFDLPLIAPLSRTGSGVPQASLAWKERARNIRGAFACQTDLRGARIALVDDVMTTGATLAEAASVLRRAGAARVECWVVARTLPPAFD